MKAKSKILVIALSLCLLVASVIGITVSANDETKPEIAGMNFSYEDNTYIWYAVKATANVTAENTTMAVYSDADCTVALQEGITGTVENIEMLGGDYIIFKAAPIKAKDITKVIYAKATSGGVDSAIVEYSLAEYLLERLYVSERQGLTVLAEEKALYEELLEYGAAAQTLFNNIDKEDAEKETLATAYKIVKVFDGTLSLGGTQAIVESGANVVFTADDVNAKYEAVKIAADGTETKTAVNSGDTITVDAHTIIQQKQIAPPLTFDSADDLGYLSLSTAYGESSIESTVEKGQKPVALQIVDGTLVLNSPVYHNNVITFARTGDATGTKAVFEADVTIDIGDDNSSTSGDALWIGFYFYGTSGTTELTQIMVADGGTNASIDSIFNETSRLSETKVTDIIKDNTKFSIRLEYFINPSGYNNVNVYLKAAGETEYTYIGRNTKRSVGNNASPAADDIGIKLEVNRFEQCTLTLDNVRFDGE